MDTARFRGPVPGRIRRRPTGARLQQRWRLLTRQSLWGAAVTADRCYCRALVRSRGEPRRRVRPASPVQEDIFPDPMSASLAEAWSSGPVKALERESAALAQAALAQAEPIAS